MQFGIGKYFLGKTHTKTTFKGSKKKLLISTTLNLKHLFLKTPYFKGVTWKDKLQEKWVWYLLTKGLHPEWIKNSYKT